MVEEADWPHGKHLWSTTAVAFRAHRWLREACARVQQGFDPMLTQAGRITPTENFDLTMNERDRVW